MFALTLSFRFDITSEASVRTTMDDSFFVASINPNIPQPAPISRVFPKGGQEFLCSFPYFFERNSANRGEFANSKNTDEIFASATLVFIVHTFAVCASCASSLTFSLGKQLLSPALENCGDRNERAQSWNTIT
ncbi:hypothetical protein ACHAW6_010142 [Cyclotella cf. meneghiniana]